MPDQSGTAQPTLTILEEFAQDMSLERSVAADSGVGIDYRPSTLRDEQLEIARGASAVLVRLARIDAEFIAECPNLKVIGRLGVGVDNIDLVAATSRGIQVINVPDYCVEEVVTHTAALMLAAWRRVAASQAIARSGRWFDWSDSSPIRPLSGCTLGIIGLGRIGRRVFETVGPMFREVVCFDPAAAIPPSGVRAKSIDAVFERSDVVTLHCPSTDTTRGMVNATRLALLPADSLLVNAARGDLVDESALIAGLQAGRPSRVALDVLATEPPPSNHPLLSHPQAIVTNHMAWLSTEADARVRTLLVRRCAAALLGGDGETVVNRVAQIRDSVG